MSEVKEHHKKLPELTVSPTNEYTSWSIKCQAFLEAWGMWDYVGGSNTTAPVIPQKIEASEVTGIDANGVQVTIVKPGNAVQYQAAIDAAKPWMEVDKRAKALIFNAVPSSHFHLVQCCTTANMAWESLKAAFLPANAERGAYLKKRMQQYPCRADMNVTQFVDDHLKMYVDLCRVDPGRMGDKEFYEMLVDLLPDSDRWVTRVASIRDRISRWVSDNGGATPNSMQVINWVKEEDWQMNKDRADTSINVYSARYEADSRKRPRNSDQGGPAAKRIRNPERRWENPHCNGIGHYKATCFAYGGGRCGKYPPWWRGPWNLHLPPNERDKPSPDVRPSSISANQSLSERIEAAPQIHHTLSERISAADTDSRANYGSGANKDYRIQLVTAHPSIFNDRLDDEELVCNATALENGPIMQECIHDSAANRHVFHSRSSFTEYEEMDPVRVKGFGKELSTAAIGKGTVLIRARYENGPWNLYDLKNCLHIPSVRYNLISQPQLDHNGIEARTLNGRVFLSKDGGGVVSGILGADDMYRLEMEPVPSNTPPDGLIAVFQTHSQQDEPLENFTTASLVI
jgi:hypothetical protein